MGWWRVVCWVGFRSLEILTNHRFELLKCAWLYPAFDRLRVFSASTVKNAPDFGNPDLSPITVGLLDRLEYALCVRMAV